jgi:hypothetical protein
VSHIRKERNTEAGNRHTCTAARVGAVRTLWLKTTERPAGRADNRIENRNDHEEGGVNSGQLVDVIGIGENSEWGK